MPKGFDRCRSEGGRVRTVKPKGKKSRAYVHVCYDKNGKSFAGHVKKRAKRKNRGG